MIFWDGLERYPKSWPSRLVCQLCILFSMSAMIEKHVQDESHVISLDLVVLGPYLSFEKEHIAILDKQV